MSLVVVLRSIVRTATSTEAVAAHSYDLPNIFALKALGLAHKSRIEHNVHSTIVASQIGQGQTISGNG